MIIETTLNIHIDTLKDINIASNITGISRTEIIIHLLKKIMNDNMNQLVISNSIKYQNKDNTENWHKFHIKLRDDDYEYFLDLRKLLKKSVSLILAFAVKKYINDLINGKTTDNYPFRNYIIAMEVIDNIICWKLFWGVPHNLYKVISFET